MWLNSNLDKYEWRPSRYGALDLFMKQSANPTGIITDQLKEMVDKTVGTTLKVPVIDYDSGITIGATRSATIADSENTSQLVTISFTTYAWGFTMVPAAFMNNQIALQKDFEVKMKKYIYKLAATLDTAAISALSTQKTQIFAGGLAGTSVKYTVASNIAHSTKALGTELLGDATVIMNANDYFGNMDFVGNSGWESIIRILAQSGQYASEMKQMQYMDKSLGFTTRISNAASVAATGYLVAEGSVGMLSRFERESLLRTKSVTGHEWDIETLPILNMPVGTYYYESVGDFNAIHDASTADLTRARKEHYGFAVDVAMITAYNKDKTSYATPILAIEVATT